MGDYAQLEVSGYIPPLPFTITRPTPPGHSATSLELLAILAAVLAPGVLSREYKFFVCILTSVVKEHSGCFRFVREVVLVYDGIQPFQVVSLQFKSCGYFVLRHVSNLP